MSRALATIPPVDGRRLRARMQNAEFRSSSSEISLAAILNILWRRKWLVILPPLAGLLVGVLYGRIVTPLYVATATIRPGITAFNPNGAGDREWRLKDITRWYEARLYARGVAERLGGTPGQAPVIQADFILRGLANIQGGNVITLTTLDADPERARRVLDASIEAFVDYAMADSLSNSIVLTQGGLEIQIEERQRQKEELDDQFARISQDIALARAESLQIDGRARELEAEIGRSQAVVDRATRQLVTVHERRMRLEDSLEDFDRALAKAGNGTGSDVEPPAGVRPGAVLSQTDVYRSILENKVEVGDRLYAAATLADSLEQAKSQAELAVEKLRVRFRNEIDLQRAESGRKLAQLRIDRDRQLPQRKRSLDLQIRERRTQLSALSPIERVGSISASAGPVRPRKKRAVLILTFLGAVGGLVLAFSWDYVSAHRREIFRRSSEPDLA